MFNLILYSSTHISIKEHDTSLLLFNNILLISFFTFMHHLISYSVGSILYFLCLIKSNKWRTKSIDLKNYWIKLNRWFDCNLRLLYIILEVNLLLQKCLINIILKDLIEHANFFLGLFAYNTLHKLLKIMVCENYRNYWIISILHTILQTFQALKPRVVVIWDAYMRKKVISTLVDLSHLIETRRERRIKLTPSKSFMQIIKLFGCHVRILSQISIISSI